MNYRALLKIRCSVSMCLHHLQFVLQCLVLWGIPEQTGALISGREKFGGQAGIRDAFHISERSGIQACCPFLGHL